MLNYNQESLNIYRQYLKNTAAISGLFSESDSPYLVSRNVENMYCLAFDAENLGRADCSADSKWLDIGIGLKTFLHGNGRTLQKVAEFNKLSNLYRDKTAKELILKIAELRNERIEFTKRNYGIKEMIYHCVTRLPGKILVFEEPMDLIEVGNIKSIKQNTNTITFDDGIHEYSFNLTKSTLYKRFILDNPLFELDVDILGNPYTALADMMKNKSDGDQSLKREIEENTKHVIGEQSVILPLFSERGGERNVPERSGLNQWNAKGRPRNANEIYIPIPKWIHHEFPQFFPARDVSFSLQVPSGEVLDAKVCQDGSKALMTNPNKALGEWLLRDVMDLDEHELLTYEMLEGLDIDSVIVTKKSNNNFTIDFCEVGTYDYFKLNHDN
ncbi:MAG: NgoFVII family restriction endonuclease [Psychrobacillus psychrodurans]